MALPKGQYDLGYLPRFGLLEYTNRFTQHTTRPTLWVDGRVEKSLDRFFFTWNHLMDQNSSLGKAQNAARSG